MLAQPARERGESARGDTARDFTRADARSAPLSVRRYTALPSLPKGGEGGWICVDDKNREDFSLFKHPRHQDMYALLASE
jgi:hypothetical protein